MEIAKCLALAGHADAMMSKIAVERLPGASASLRDGADNPAEFF